MKLVLDTSVAAKIVLAEVDSNKAIAVRDDFANGLHDLLAPDIFPAELAHTLTRAERQKRITVGEAERHWQNVLLSGPKLVPYLPLSPRAGNDARSIGNVNIHYPV